LGFERYGGNCPSWEGELSGGVIVQGEMSVPRTNNRRGTNIIASNQGFENYSANSDKTPD